MSQNAPQAYTLLVLLVGWPVYGVWAYIGLLVLRYVMFSQRGGLFVISRADSTIISAVRSNDFSFPSLLPEVAMRIAEVAGFLRPRPSATVGVLS